MTHRRDRYSYEKIIRNLKNYPLSHLDEKFLKDERTSTKVSGTENLLECRTFTALRPQQAPCANSPFRNASLPAVQPVQCFEQDNAEQRRSPQVVHRWSSFSQDDSTAD